MAEPEEASPWPSFTEEPTSPAEEAAAKPRKSQDEGHSVPSEWPEWTHAPTSPADAPASNAEAKIEHRDDDGPFEPTKVASKPEDKTGTAEKVQLPVKDEGGNEKQWGKVQEMLSDSKAQDLPAYDPTSPASDNEAEGVTATDGAVAESMWDELVEPKAATGSAAERQLAGRSSKKEDREVVPSPVLLVGSQLSKECVLKAGKWIEVGRHAKAHVLMNNPAVSKHHCKLQWKKGGSHVELRVLDGITYVNDKRLNIGTAMFLSHGDLVKVNGKGVSFRLLLNMRPINITWYPDVRTMSNYANACKEALQGTTRSPEEELRRKVRKLRAASAAAREKAIDQEQRLIDMQTNRAQRAKIMQEELDKSLWFEKETERLTALLSKSRDDWLERLQQQSELQEKACAPLHSEASATQLKLDSLNFLKAQQEKAVHPERHVGSVSSEAPPRIEVERSPAKGDPVRMPALVDEADGEEEALADGPARGLGVDDDKPLVKPTVEVVKNTAAADEIADLFGDFDSEEEQETQAKRPRVA